MTSSHSVDGMSGFQQRSGLTITVKPGSRHITADTNNDMELDRLLAVFGTDMEDIIKQILEVNII